MEYTNNPEKEFNYFLEEALHCVKEMDITNEEASYIYSLANELSYLVETALHPDRPEYDEFFCGDTNCDYW